MPNNIVKKTETITIPKNEYIRLKKKVAIADDVIVQLEKSLTAAEKEKIREAEH